MARTDSDRRTLKRLMMSIRLGFSKPDVRIYVATSAVPAPVRSWSRLWAALSGGRRGLPSRGRFVGAPYRNAQTRHGACSSPRHQSSPRRCRRMTCRFQRARRESGLRPRDDRRSSRQRNAGMTRIAEQPFVQAARRDTGLAAGKKDDPARTGACRLVV
jgi:hypothetical protein